MDYVNAVSIKFDYILLSRRIQSLLTRTPPNTEGHATISQLSLLAVALLRCRVGETMLRGNVVVGDVVPGCGHLLSCGVPHPVAASALARYQRLRCVMACRVWVVNVRVLLFTVSLLGVDEIVALVRLSLHGL